MKTENPKNKGQQSLAAEHHCWGRDLGWISCTKASDKKHRGAVWGREVPDPPSEPCRSASAVPSSPPQHPPDHLSEFIQVNFV